MDGRYDDGRHGLKENGDQGPWFERKIA